MSKNQQKKGTKDLPKVSEEHLTVPCANLCQRCKLTRRAFLAAVGTGMAGAAAGCNMLMQSGHNDPKEQKMETKKEEPRKEKVK